MWMGDWFTRIHAELTDLCWTLNLMDEAVQWCRGSVLGMMVGAGFLEGLRCV